MNAGELGPGIGVVPHLLVTTGAASRGTLLDGGCSSHHLLSPENHSHHSCQVRWSYEPFIIFFYAPWHLWVLEDWQNWEEP